MEANKDTIKEAKMNSTIQKTRLEEAKERQELIKRADKDGLIYWHYESIKEELRQEVKERG